MSNFFDDDDFFSDKKSRNSSNDFDFSDQKDDDPFSFNNDDSGWGGGLNEPPSGSDGLPTPPKWAWIAVGVVAALIVGGLGIGSVLSGGNEVVEPTPSPSISESPIPTPTPSETVDLYSQPKNLQAQIDKALKSTVTVFCGGGTGSGWVIDLEDSFSTNIDDEYQTEIITNYHVISDCLNGEPIDLLLAGEEYAFTAYLFNYDQENDLAVLMTDRDLPALEPVADGFEPQVGHWVMAVGSPAAVELLTGSVTTGQITNVLPDKIVSDAAINPGNSGGPLINALGQVLGTNTEKIADVAVDNISYSFRVHLMCVSILNCE